MTREEKETIGKARAVKFFEAVKKFECFKNATDFKFTEPTTGKHAKPAYFRLYNGNAEKYANRPIYKTDLDYDTIEGRAYNGEVGRLFSAYFLK